jgi:hypothetical protein
MSAAIMIESGIASSLEWLVHAALLERRRTEGPRRSS